ncbi:hypothetical protein FOVG_19203 [Fusarium oxysporum f. sp. pisi HDV247]|uniref:Uncharacterized protein n=1 Tax=Fusarium oxysporum f. sp. pisi HDV247 TaxID=1080344 RepID=W9N9H9_FUSOX|nr:hypothetical protein FOVG_19203 [Fusarium oxysporum f. sp. pisi HDV247]
MPSIIQHALAGEAILNGAFSIASILFPGRLLSSLVASESVPNIIESALVSIVLWQTTQPDASGFTFNGLISLLGSVVPALVWHLYVLLSKPHWFKPESAYSAEGKDIRSPKKGVVIRQETLKRFSRRRRIGTLCQVKAAR